MAFKFDMKDDEYDQISDEAKAYQKEYKESGGFQAGVPVCFLGDGNYIFRIYPDRDSKGFIRLFRRAYIHNGITIGGKKFRFWQDERVNQLVQEAADAGMEKIFGKALYTFRSKENGYMMVHLYECPESEYTKPKNSYAAVLNRRQMFAVQDFIAELHPEDKRQILDPNIPAPAIKLSITRGAGKSNVSCGIASMQKLLLPELEFKDENGALIEYKGLDHVYITEEDKLSDDDYFALRTAVHSEITNFQALGPAQDHSAEAHKIGQSPSESPPPQTSPAVSTPQLDEHGNVRCRLAEAGKINPKMAETYPGAKFGNKPEGITPYCLACEVEALCKDATKKQKAAA
jgi:hypothetical protein